jgi:hypothetical protein
VPKLNKKWAEELKKEFIRNAEQLLLFREGAFGTIDEFSYLARGRFPLQVQTLKWWLSLVFAVQPTAQIHEARFPERRKNDRL